MQLSRQLLLPLIRRIFAMVFCINVLALKSSAAPFAIAWDVDPASADPRFLLDQNSIFLSNLTQCALVNFDENGQPYGDLARSWTWTAKSTLNVKIKDNIRFANGDLLSIEDVKSTYDYQLQKLAAPNALAQSLKNIAAIRVLSKNEIQFELKEMDASFPSQLFLGILPTSQVQLPANTDPERFMGCGPYQLKSSMRGQYQLEANSHYSIGTKPKIKSLAFVVIKDEVSRLKKLQSNDVHMVENALARDKVTSLAAAAPHLKVITRPGLRTTYLGFDLKDPTLKSKAVRQAINLSINRSELIRFVLGGFATPAETILSRYDPFFNRNLKRPAFELEAARKWLNSIKTTRHELTLKTTTDVNQISTAQAIAAQLKKVGIIVKVSAVGDNPLGNDPATASPQLWLSTLPSYQDPDIYRQVFADYRNPQLAELFETGKQLSSFNARKKTYDQVQEIIAKEVPYVFLWHEDVFAVHSKKLKNFKLYADGRYFGLVGAEFK